MNSLLHKLRKIGPVLGILAFLGGARPMQGAEWLDRLDGLLPLLGHRNWIVIVDSAYPLQVSPGVTYELAGDEVLPALRSVLALLDKSKHVRANVFVDRELAAIPEKSVTGIGRYRSELDQVLSGRSVASLPHGDLIQKLDQAGKAFRVVILKTKQRLPYSSVFLELDCAYWNAELEAQLRAKMKP